MYLELRTTPKARLEHGVTKRSYIEAVLAGMKEGSTQECNRGGNRWGGWTGVVWWWCVRVWDVCGREGQVVVVRMTTDRVKGRLGTHTYAS